MRLGDLDNLKEVINDMFRTGEYDCNSVLKAIDSAPTVDFIISPNYVTELQNLNKELTKQLEETERPQGEWIITDIGFARCPFCNCERQYPENYCGYCGADLRSEDNV